MLPGGASEENSEMAKASFLYCSCCHARVAIREVCGVRKEALFIAEADDG